MPETYWFVVCGSPRTKKKKNPPYYLFWSMKKSNIKPRQALYVTEVNFFFFFFKGKIFLQDEAKGSEQLWGHSSRVGWALGPCKPGSDANIFTWSLTLFLLAEDLLLVLKDSLVTIKFLWAFKRCLIYPSVISWTVVWLFCLVQMFSFSVYLDRIPWSRLYLRGIQILQKVFLFLE